MAKRSYPRKPEEEKRIPFTLSLSGPRLKQVRSAFEAKEGRIPSKAELVEIAQQLSYGAIDAYCESAERETIIIL